MGNVIVFRQAVSTADPRYRRWSICLPLQGQMPQFGEQFPDSRRAVQWHRHCQSLESSLKRFLPMPRVMSIDSRIDRPKQSFQRKTKSVFEWEFS